MSDACDLAGRDHGKKKAGSIDAVEETHDNSKEE